ncbi:MAG: hypothetical protein RLZZ293_753 [Pseudomonadota bacterium]|jgi:type IV pilus assembly protein PilZ
MNIIKVNISSKVELLKMYMPQLKHGGVFVIGNFNYTIGDEIFLILSLPNSNENLAVDGHLVWLSPTTAVGYPVGIGVEFNANKTGIEAKSKIELLLGGMLQNRSSSYTF